MKTQVGLLDNKQYCIICRIGDMLAKVSIGTETIDVFKSRLTILPEMPMENLLEIAKSTKVRLFEIINFFKDKNMESSQWTYVVEKNYINKAIEIGETEKIIEAIISALEKILIFNYDKK